MEHQWGERGSNCVRGARQSVLGLRDPFVRALTFAPLFGEPFSGKEIRQRHNA